MALKYLTKKIASERFEQLKAIVDSPQNLYNKIVSSKGKKEKVPTCFRSVMLSTIHDIIHENEVTIAKASVWDLLQYIIQNSPVNFGEILSDEVTKVYTGMNNLLKDPRDVNNEEYRKTLKTISEFIALLSGLTIPNELSSVWDVNITDQDMFDNPTTRVPVVLCLDVSSSMIMENRIEQLNKGVKAFFDSVRDDSIAKWAAEICIVVFNNEARQLIDFNYVDKQASAFEELNLIADGNTAMGAAVNLSLDLLEKRKALYRSSSIDYWQPWLVLMTDGQATDEIESAAARCSKLVKEGKLVLFPLAIGNGANMAQLKRFSPKRAPMRLNANKISEFFNWLSRSVRTTSQSTVGTEVSLPDISSWAVL